MKKKISLKIVLLIALALWCKYICPHTMVIAGEPACNDPDYLQEARKPHRVMNTVLEAWCRIIDELERCGITTTVIGRDKLQEHPSADLYIFWDMPNFYDNPLIAQVADKAMVVLCEPISIFGQYNPWMLRHFKRVFTWDDQFAQTFDFTKYCLPVLKPYQGSPVPFEQKKLACMICGNKSSWCDRELYSDRRSIINFFSDRYPDLFDLYGPGWDGVSTYKGMPHAKLPCLQQYRFNICLENTRNTTGYITEKIFDAMQAGCIPVYAGASNMDSYIPRTCYIAYEDFTSLETLKERMCGVTEQDYEQYQENIRTYLASPEAQQFSIESFVALFLGEIKQFFEI